MVYEMIQKTGIQHSEGNQECEDIIYYKELPECYCFGIADGKSGRRYCREGGTCSLECITEYIQEKGMANLLKEGKHEMNQRIRQRLTMLSEVYGVGLDEFASTLMFFVMDRELKRYIVFHIGDGIILAVQTNGKQEFISPPDNGITAYHTWLTTSTDSEEHFFVREGRLEDYKNILLVSDGATDVYVGKSLTRRFQKMLSSATTDDVISYFKNTKSMDDASYIVLEI